ncbi:MAG TPA: hypothetical protein P5208_09090 [Smithellaceae bacterium]|nr:hypothetical protein [Smithellaceae bacterium]HRV45445.1 hypothetical protein [Smithellaceae bacterium]
MDIPSRKKMHAPFGPTLFLARTGLLPLMRQVKVRSQTEPTPIFPGNQKNLPDRLVGFPAVNTLMGPAEGTKLAFNLFDKPERGAFLFFAGLPAYWALHADQRHFAIPVCNFTAYGFYGRFSRGSFCFSFGHESFTGRPALL